MTTEIQVPKEVKDELKQLFKLWKRLKFEQPEITKLISKGELDDKQ